MIFQNQSVKPHYPGKAFVGQNLTHRPKLLRGGKSVQVALRHKFPIGAIVGNLFGNLRLFLFGKFAYIQFVTERACASHVVASLRRKSASRLVVGTNGVMRRHCALRIAKGSTLLNECSAIGVCVVACPDLRKIVQHCTVETASSATAPFHQHVGEALRQFLCQRIHAQNISVRHFALTLRRQKWRIQIGKVPVHIPFDVVDVVFAYYVAYFSENVFHHFGVGKIQHKLISSTHPSRIGIVQHPLGMCAEKFRAFVDHFRFYPQSEFKLQIMTLFGNLFKSATQFLRVDLPISQTVCVVVAVGKPAVVQHKGVGAYLLGTVDNFKQFVGVKIEVGCFPIVDHYRTWGKCKLGIYYVLAVEIVKRTGHFP